MKPTTRHACLSLALLVTAGLAVAQTTTTAPTSQPQVQFKVVDTPFEVATPPGDPTLENSEYVAVFRGGDRTVQWHPAPGAASQDFEPWLRQMVDKTPGEFLPSDRIRALLSTRAPGVVRIRWVPADTERKGPPPRPVTGADGVQRVETEMVTEFQILAATPQRAEELAKALFTAFDHGYAEPTRAVMLEQIKILQTRLAEAKEASAKAKARLAELDAKLQQIQDVDPEAMKELKKDRLLLMVQIAGTKARMEAAKAQITSSPSSPSDQAKNRQLEEITSATSIELAGLLASQQQIRILIFEGDERQELLTQRKAAQGEALAAEQAMHSYTPVSGDWKASPLIEDNIKGLQAELPALEPMASQVGVVNIYPIKRPASSGTTPNAGPSAQPTAPGMGMPSSASPMMPPAR